MCEMKTEVLKVGNTFVYCKNLRINSILVKTNT